MTDAAERLGVSVSTAHRLLAMLVYREFAGQQEDGGTAPVGCSAAGRPPMRPCPASVMRRCRTFAGWSTGSARPRT